MQPGGAELEHPQHKLAQVLYPNWNNDKPGTPFTFHFYEPAEGWEPYGRAHVSADGRQVVPDPGVGIYELTAAALSGDYLGLAPWPEPCPDPVVCSCPRPAPPNKPWNAPGGDASNAPGTPNCADPVSASTGLFTHAETDFSINDTLPLELTRTYGAGDSASHLLGQRHRRAKTYTRVPPLTGWDSLIVRPGVAGTVLR